MMKRNEILGTINKANAMILPRECFDEEIYSQVNIIQVNIRDLISTL